jgi:hypothetical protein
MVRRRVVSSGLATLICLVGLPASSYGESVRLWVPNDVAITSSTDRIIITGRSLGTIELTTCPPAGQYPVQSVVAVDSAGQGATRSSHVILSSAQAPGTRLSNLISAGDCIDGGMTYNIFTATTE